MNYLKNKFYKFECENNPFMRKRQKSAKNDIIKNWLNDLYILIAKFKEHKFAIILHLIGWNYLKNKFYKFECENNPFMRKRQKSAKNDILKNWLNDL